MFVFALFAWAAWFATLSIRVLTSPITSDVLTDAALLVTLLVSVGTVVAVPVTLLGVFVKNQRVNTPLQIALSCNRRQMRAHIRSGGCASALVYWHYVKQAPRRKASSRLSGGATVPSPTKAGHEALRELIHADAAHQATAGDVIKTDQAAKIIAPFAYSAAAAKYLADCGVATPMIGTATHQHPIHRTLENYLLAKCLPDYGQEQVLILWMKQWKATKIAANGVLGNLITTVRDTIRYGSTVPNVSLPRSSPKHCFMHDAMHFFDESMITKLFATYDSLDTIDYTIVVPAEVLIKATSHKPSVYQITYVGDKFLYELEGHPEDHYEQPVTSARWLTMKSVDGHSIERLASYGAHHLYRATRSKLISKEFDSFPVPRAVVLPNDAARTIPLAQRLVDQDAYVSTTTNARVVKGNYTIHSAAAKLSTMSDNKTDGKTEWMHPMAHQHMEAYAMSHRDSRQMVYGLQASSRLERACTRARLTIAHTLHTLRFALLTLAVACVVAAYRKVDVQDFTVASWSVQRVSLQGLVRLIIDCNALAPWMSPGSGRMLLYGSFEKLVIRDAQRYLALAQDWSVPVLFYGVESYHDRVQVPTFLFSRRLRAFIENNQQLTMTNLAGESLTRHWSEFPRRPFGLRTRHALRRWIGNDNDYSKLTNAVLRLDSPRMFTTTTTVHVNVLGALACLFVALVLLALARSAFNFQPARAAYMSHVARTQAQPYRLLVKLEDRSSDYAGSTYSLTDDFPHWKPAPKPAKPTAVVEVPEIEDDTTEPTVATEAPLYKNMCLWDALSELTSLSANTLLRKLAESDDDWWTYEETGWNTTQATRVLEALGISVLCKSAGPDQILGCGPRLAGHIEHTADGIGHFTAVTHVHVPTTQQPTEDTHCPALEGDKAPIQAIIDLLAKAQYKGTRLAFDKARDYDITRKAVRDPLLPKKKITRCKYLASDYKNRCTGLLLDVSSKDAAAYTKAVDSIVDNLVRAPVKLISIAGYNGCGKSAPLTQFLKNNPSIMACTKVATPENKLAAQWIADIGLFDQDAFRVGSYEATCFKKTARILVVDEVGKMKNGYVDLCIALDQAIELVIVLGDPTQLGASETKKVDGKVQAKWIRLKDNEATHFARFADYYCLYTYRSCQETARRWAVKSYSKVKGSITRSTLPLKNGSFSAMAQATVDRYAPGLNAQTHASTQGATFEDLHDIALDHDFIKYADKRMMNMLTNRSKVGINFSGLLSKKEQQIMAANAVVQNFISGKVQPIRTLFAQELKGLKIIEAPLTVELSGGRALTRTQQRNALKRKAKLTAPKETFTGFCDEDLPTELKVGFSHLQGPEQLKSSAPGIDENTRPGTHFPARPLLDWANDQLLVEDVREREMLIRGEWSNQFPEFQSLKAPVEREALMNVTPTHSEKNDPTLLPGSKKKRLPMATLEENQRSMRQQKDAGALLFQAFHSARGMPQENQRFDDDLFVECIMENDLAKLTGKAKSVLKHAGPKSSADWALTTVQIFMKSQQKVKPDNLNGKWKAGQTLAQMNDQWLLIFGPVVRYIVKQDQRWQPESTFILGGSTLCQMHRWCASFIRGSRFTTNDYTAFDQSQGAEAVWFELNHMAYYSIPQTYLDLYEEQKTTLNHQFGRSAIMRFTGEPGTYKFNTMFSEALMNLQYQIGAPYMCSGDDSLIVGWAQVRSSWANHSKLFAIVAKTEFIEQPLFCGFICTSAGIIREPVHFAMKLALAVVSGKFDDVAASYAVEYSYGHKLGGFVDEILNSNQREAHAAIGQYLFANSPGRVRAMLSTLTLTAQQALKYNANTVSALRGKSLLAAYHEAMKGLTSRDC